MLRTLLVSCALVLAVPAAARAAEVSSARGVLHYVAAPSTVSNVTFVESPPGTVVVTRISMDTDPLVPVAPLCTGDATTVTCTAVTRVDADAGDMQDRFTATGLTVAAALSGGDGRDALDGGAGTDTLDGGADDDELKGGDENDLLDGGAGNDTLDGWVGNDTLDGGAGDDDLEGWTGNDTLRGSDGDDLLRPNTGTDAITGGEGIDQVVFQLRATPTYTLDGLPNDGAAGENDLIGTDIEDVTGSAPGTDTVTIVGDGRGNRLKVTSGKGNITGGEGYDALVGGPQDDMFNARDGSPDTVVCNGGADTALVDTLDLVSPTCENVQTAATPGGPFDDRPPVIAWTAPTNLILSANRATTLAVDASDDRGLARIQFFDDDRLVCEDSTAPYTCAYQPRGPDVGRNTLIAVAIDGANQTASLVRAVTVRRFTPRQLGLSLQPSRDRRAPYAFLASGRVLRPTYVTSSQGCSGTVTVTAKASGRMVATRAAKLSRACEYRATVSFKSRPANRVIFTARFGGNDVLSSRASRSRAARLG